MVKVMRTDVVHNFKMIGVNVIAVKEVLLSFIFPSKAILLYTYHKNEYLTVESDQLKLTKQMNRFLHYQIWKLSKSLA